MKISNDIRIFIIEDDQAQSEILNNKLLEFNAEYNIVHFKKGNDLFTHFESVYNKNKDNYVILEYYLQTKEDSDIINGYEIIQLLRERYPKVRIILFSAFENDDDTTFNQLAEEINVLEIVKKSHHAYSSIQNIIRFDYAHKSLLKKKRRFHITLSVFVAMLSLSILHFIFTFLSF